jgi:hypothetical protein
MTDSFSTLTDSNNISEAWIKAVRLLRDKGGQAYNLIYSITDPDNFAAEDALLIASFDKFAKNSEINTVSATANTIFPLDFYLKNGCDGLFSRYDVEMYPKVKKQWGNYFDRITRRRDLKGRPMSDADGLIINPLSTLVNKVRRRVSTGLGSRTHYELAVADEAFELTTYLPEKDRNYPRGGPCLSHLSVKVDDEGKIRLTAFYRSHYYMEKALGNLVGLARLQAFIAVEAGAKSGPLTCIASQAVLESSVGTASAGAVSAFLGECGA